MNRQVVAEDLRRELESLIGEAEAAHGAVRTILSRNAIDARESDNREAISLAQLQAHGHATRVYGLEGDERRPEADFLGAIDAVDGNVSIGLTLLVLVTVVRSVSRKFSMGCRAVGERRRRRRDVRR